MGSEEDKTLSNASKDSPPNKRRSSCLLVVFVVCGLCAMVQIWEVADVEMEDDARLLVYLGEESVVVSGETMKMM
jgi:hypothetical protein